MSLGPILAATFAVSDLDRSARIYRDGLDLSEIASGHLSRGLASDWGAPELAGARWIGLANQADLIGGVRLVEVGPIPAFRPLAVLGWAAAEFSVHGVDIRAKAMAAAGFRVLGAPRPLGSNAAISAAQFAGPDGEAIYVTDVRAYEGPFQLRRASRPVDRCFVAVLATGELEATRAFYESTFATSRMSDRRVLVPVLTDSLGLEPGEVVRISSQQLSGSCLLEIDAYPAAAARRPVVKGLPAGLGIVTFAGRASGPPGPADWPYLGRPLEIRRDPHGELLELVGMPH